MLPSSEREYYLPNFALKHKWARPMLGSLPFALALHWTFQGILYMDTTERWFKILTEIIVAIGIILVASIWMEKWVAAVLSLLLAHTFNFVFNAQPMGVLSKFGRLSVEPKALEDHVLKIRERVLREPSLSWLAAYGSYAREQLHASSDVDLRVIRGQGFINAIRACAFVSRERLSGSLNRLPIDIYVVDGKRSLERMTFAEHPRVLVDKNRESGLKSDRRGTNA